MSDTLEQMYATMINQLNNIKIPNVISNPAGNIFCTKAGSINALHGLFSPLNRVAVSLSRTSIAYDVWIRSIQDPQTTKQEMVNLIIEAAHSFEKERGECLNYMRTQMEKFREI